MWFLEWNEMYRLLSICGTYMLLKILALKEFGREKINILFFIDIYGKNIFEGLYQFIYFLNLLKVDIVIYRGLFVYEQAQYIVAL
jgi:hypothetical protein